MSPNHSVVVFTENSSPVRKRVASRTSLILGHGKLRHIFREFKHVNKLFFVNIFRDESIREPRDVCLSTELYISTTNYSKPKGVRSFERTLTLESVHTPSVLKLLLRGCEHFQA